MQKYGLLHKIFNLLIISLMFDAYAIVYIKRFPVTVFTIFSIIYVLVAIGNLCDKNKTIKTRKSNCILLIFMLLLVMNFLFHGTSITSFMQSIYFCVLCFLAYRHEDKVSFEDYIVTYQKCMTVMAIYAIYQLFGRLWGLPLADLVIENHMVVGYNWTNPVSIAGQTLYRSNAICREPSYLSQLLAISLLFYVPLFIGDNANRSKIKLFPIIIQLIALIFTFAGTGIFILGISLLLYIIIVKKSKKTWKKILLWGTIGGIFAVAFLTVTPIGQYLLSRVSELFTYHRDAASGFVRFRAWLYVVQDSWNENFLLGSGIGTGANYVKEYSNLYYGMTLHGFARVATELGLLGISIWMCYILTYVRRRDNDIISNQLLILACSILPLIFMMEAFSSNIFWLFLMLMNVRFDKDVKVY